jgi:DNA-binding NarL/FixJ family response regulator
VTIILYVNFVLEKQFIMRKIKVMLASRPKMISDVICNIIERQPDMMMVGEVIDPIKLLFATRETAVDVVIVTPLKVNGEPKICSHLLAEHPQLKIIILMAEGKAGFLYESGSLKKHIDEPSADTIVDIIRGSHNKITV